VQAQIASYYQVQYNAMKQSGLYTEGRLDRNFTINENNTLFGTWFYYSGWFNLTASDHQYGYYAFNGAILDIINVNQTDPATFYKDKKSGTNFNASMQGVYSDSENVGTVAGYTSIGGSYMYPEQGTFQAGIYCLNAFFDTSRSLPIYMKYELIQNASNNMFQDELKVQYSNTLASAQGAFNATALLYTRVWTNNN